MSLFDRAGLIFLAYLLGSIPTGVLIGHWKGVDPRTVGSGNIGATNVGRALGRDAALWTLAGDALKGFLPVLAAHHLAPEDGLIASLVGLAAVAGHCFSLFLDFGGGKGVATAFGVFLALAPVPTLLAAAVWGAVVGATRTSSLGALVAVPVLVALLLLPAWDLSGIAVPAGRVWLPLAIAVGALVIARHRANLRRILEGSERKIVVGRKG